MKGTSKQSLLTPATLADKNQSVMKTFKFYQDVKCTIWVRQSFNIEAESLDEAFKTNDDIKKDFLH